MDLRIKPVDGAVVRYSFLWSHEHKAGLREGSKDRMMDHPEPSH